MGLYNLVSGRMTCPRCGTVMDAEAETRLGYMHEVLALKVGDRYPWSHPEMPSHRPEGGNAVGDGYCVCPTCGKDFFVNVVVEADVIRRLEHDPTCPGMID
jgi:hypothetical protein